MSLLIDADETRLTEFHRPGLNRASYPGTDSETCCMDVCGAYAAWRIVAGCPSEHVARLNYCESHAILVSMAVLSCAACGKKMRAEAREKM